MDPLFRLCSILTPLSVSVNTKTALMLKGSSIINEPNLQPAYQLRIFGPSDPGRGGTPPSACESSFPCPFSREISIIKHK